MIFIRRGGWIKVLRLFLDNLLRMLLEFKPSRKRRQSQSLKELIMNWVAPIVEEICVGMEVTSYESAEVEF